MDQIRLLRKDLEKLANPEKAIFLQRFFKTGKGEYGYGDVFLGIIVPESRKIAEKYKDIPLKDIEKLLHSRIHEERLIALLILVINFMGSNENLRKTVYDFYLSQTTYINNWDLVDLSADKIVGGYLLEETPLRPKGFAGQAKGRKVKNIEVLEKLARSSSVWERRIAMIATYEFIKHGYCEEALAIADMLKDDTHDLIQKAVGWMLREVGKRCSLEVEENFLKERYKTMPRTMLRYAIERFSEEKRKSYLAGKI
jgi:3-methyladenine DNA glycosylase AlkD